MMIDDKIRQMIIAEVTKSIQEMLPVIIKEIVQKRVDDAIDEHYALHFDDGNDYY